MNCEPDLYDRLHAVWGWEALSGDDQMKFIRAVKLSARFGDGDEAEIPVIDFIKTVKLTRKSLPKFVARMSKGKWFLEADFDDLDDTPLEDATIRITLCNAAVEPALSPNGRNGCPSSSGQSAQPQRTRREKTEADERHNANRRNHANAQIRHYPNTVDLTQEYASGTRMGGTDAPSSTPDLTPGSTPEPENSTPETTPDLRSHAGAGAESGVFDSDPIPIRNGLYINNGSDSDPIREESTFTLHDVERELLRQGITAKRVKALFAKYKLGFIRQVLDMVADRNADNPAAMIEDALKSPTKPCYVNVLGNQTSLGLLHTTPGSKSDASDPPVIASRNGDLLPKRVDHLNAEELEQEYKQFSTEVQTHIEEAVTQQWGPPGKSVIKDGQRKAYRHNLIRKTIVRHRQEAGLEATG